MGQIKQKNGQFADYITLHVIVGVYSIMAYIMLTYIMRNYAYAH